MSHKYAPPFATLALIQNVGGRGGGAYTQDATFSLVITPSLDQEMFSGSVDAGFVLALPFHHGGLMCGMKIPLQDFVLKIQGGGVFAGHYGNTKIYNI